MQTEAPPGATARILAVTAVIAIIGFSLWRSLGGPDILFVGLVSCACVLVISQFRHIPSNLRTTSMLLLGASLVVLPFARAPLAAVQRGVFIAGLLLALMASVMLLARCAMRSRQVQIIGSTLRAQKPGRRYGSFTLAGQIFSSMLGMAGANITFVMAAPAGEPRSERKTATVVAVTRGFAAASFWSPMFGNMAILLALYPALRWTQLFPAGLALAQIAMVSGIVLHRFRRPQPVAQPDDAPPPGFARAAIPLLGAMLAFLALVLAVSGTLQISTTSAIVLLAPGTAVCLNFAMAHRGRRIKEGLGRLREDVLRFPGLASEAILFVAAGCAGSILGDAFPQSWAVATGAALDGSPFLAVAFLMFGMMALSLTGIHPVLMAIFLATTLSPDLLGLPPVLHACAILTGWGLSASLTPFSVLSLTASRYSGDSLVQISLLRNWLFALVSAVSSCLLLGAWAHAVR